MANRPHWQLLTPVLLAVALLTAGLLTACGGGGGDGAMVVATPVTVPQGPGSPVATGDTAVDGLNWINYRRAQLGLSVLARNSLMDTAAQGHSNYLRVNNTVTHFQTTGQPGFTGVAPQDRLKAAGYTLAGPFAYGEVISANTNSSGAVQAEGLIAAIYHRFVIFEPIFKEIGTGAATGNGYTYFTADMAANHGYGAGLGQGHIITYPADKQTMVDTSFFSDNESPDPVPTQNEVGYPISVHADISATIIVQSFTVAPHGGSALSVRLLSKSVDTETPPSAAAIIPLAVLSPATTYDVAFSGQVDGVSVTRQWSFSTK